MNNIPESVAQAVRYYTAESTPTSMSWGSFRIYEGATYNEINRTLEEFNNFVSGKTSTISSQTLENLKYWFPETLASVLSKVNPQINVENVYTLDVGYINTLLNKYRSIISEESKPTKDNTQMWIIFFAVVVVILLLVLVFKK